MHRVGVAMVGMAVLLHGTPAGAQSITYIARTVTGDSIRIAAGQPATLVAVFATWCTTCRNEFGTLDSLQKALAPRGIRVLALSVDDKDDAHVSRYARARNTRVPVARDATGTVGRTFGTVGVPETYLVDSKGVIRWRGRGDLRTRVPDLRQALTSLK